jgi:hypothetical protein
MIAVGRKAATHSTVEKLSCLSAWRFRRTAHL